MSSDPAPVRRRLEDQAEKTRLPIGCMAWGGVLGVLVGVMFALYGLPPILRAIYGETTVPFGEPYEGEARVIAIESVSTGDDAYEVAVRVRSNRSWAMTEEDWQLEVAGQEDWIPAMPSDPGIPATAFDVPLGEERTLLLRFPRGEGGEPVALHLADPRLGFELQPGDAGE